MNVIRERLQRRAEAEGTPVDRWALDRADVCCDAHHSLAFGARFTPENMTRLRDDRRARSSLEIGAIVHVVRLPAADLLATLCFYAVFAATGSVGIATALAPAPIQPPTGSPICDRNPPSNIASLLITSKIFVIRTRVSRSGMRACSTSRSATPSTPSPRRAA